jgi:flagellar basal body-associated protein FliL
MKPGWEKLRIIVLIILLLCGSIITSGCILKKQASDTAQTEKPDQISPASTPVPPVATTPTRTVNSTSTIVANDSRNQI